MDENNTNAIYEFGKEIVIDARDGTINVLQNTLRGEAFGKIGKKFMKKLIT